MSDSEKVFNDADSADKSFENSDRDVDDYADDGDRELDRRPEGRLRTDDAPDDEDIDDAGYGGRDQYAVDEQEEQFDDDERGQTMEMQYSKDIGDNDDGSIDQFREDDDDDNYVADDRRSSKKKKKGDKEEKTKKRKKVKRDDDEAEEDKYIEDDYDRPGKKGKRRNKDDTLDDNELEGLKRLVREMDEAYALDIVAMKNKQPAMNKLKLLPKIEASLRRGAAQKEFIDQTAGLDAFAKWLSKLPNGASPSLQIKKKFADILLQLPVTDDHLRDSDIGKVVYGLRNNAMEEPELRSTFKSIVDKWTRLLTDSAHDYAPSQYEARDRKKIEVSLDDYRQRGMSDLKKSIPRMVNKRSGFDFVHRLEEKKGLMRNTNARQQSNEECDKLIKDMKRKMRKEFK